MTPVIPILTPTPAACRGALGFDVKMRVESHLKYYWGYNKLPAVLGRWDACVEESCAFRFYWFYCFCAGAGVRVC